MTDQLERDLMQMFNHRAAETHVPPPPIEVLTAEPPSLWRRRAVIGLVAAAAVAAIAVPLGLNARNDDRVVPPTEQPAPSNGMKLPYVFEGELHVGGDTVPVDPNTSLQVAWDTVLVVTTASNGSDARWDRLDGTALVDLPFLDDVNSVQPSYDGALVAAPIGSESATSVRVWDLSSGDVVDTFQLADPPAYEEPVIVGFDAAGYLYWHDGAAVKARTPAGEVVTVDTGAGAFVGIAPGGVLVRTGNSDTVTIGAVREDGSVVLGAQVPVSASATWRDASTVAYQEVGTGRLFVVDVTTGKRTEVTVKGRPQLDAAGWSGADLVVTAFDQAVGTDVVVVDLATGEQRTEFSFDLEATYPFAATGGTGAL